MSVKCWGQTYYNATNMSAAHTGLQAQNKEICHVLDVTGDVMQHTHVSNSENGKVPFTIKATKKKARQTLAHPLDQTFKIINSQTFSASPLRDPSVHEFSFTKIV